MQPFEIAVDQSVLDDLARRLDSTRWPQMIPDSGWDYGTDAATLRALMTYWRDSYDWRAREAYYNQYPQFLTEAAGVRVHGYHVRSAEPDAIPIVLIHGYPGSVVEFREMIGPLVDPEAHGGAAGDAFHVVVPSLPGYGFSGPTTTAGVDVVVCADTIAAVMDQLGYDRYIVQGGDWGSLVARTICERHADKLIAAHFNMLFAMPGPDDEPAEITDDEQARMTRAFENIADGTGYMSLLSTKPDTLNFGLNDSPLGLASWLLEKFHAWCDLDEGDPLSVFTMDQLIDNIMWFWVTGTAASAGRLYYESKQSGTSALDSWTGRIDVPTGHAVYPGELLQTPRSWAERRYNIVHWTVQERGGHFAPFEQPELFVTDLRHFGRRFR